MTSKRMRIYRWQTLIPIKSSRCCLIFFLMPCRPCPTAAIILEIAAQKDFMDVIVSDTGSGIKEEDLPRIYDPYFTSKPAGTGLGLAVVQKIMEAHGGGIQMESIEERAQKSRCDFLYRQRRE